MLDTLLKFDDRGLIPAVLQDVTTGQVLMVAWMNEESLRLTRETGEAHFWSRSRQELWHKGATSGNVQRVREIWMDCDADTLVIKVEPAGPACHTGEKSCFYRKIWPETTLRFEGAAENQGGDMSDVLDELFAVILDRKENPTPGSYTAKLLSGGDEVLKKVGEEAIEVLLAGKGQSDERLIEESADLLYHLLVLLASRGLTLDNVRAELGRRRR